MGFVWRTFEPHPRPNAPLEGMGIYTSQMFVLIPKVQPEFPPLEKEGQGGFEEVVATAEAIGNSQISPDPSLLTDLCPHDHPLDT